MNNREVRRTSRVLKRNPAPLYALSLWVALLMAAASILGLLWQDSIYPSEELVRSFVPNDAVTLLIGLPMLLGSVWLAIRGRLVGLLLWPGALFYVLYNYAIYVLAMPFNVGYVFYLTLVTFSFLTLILLVTGMNGVTIREQLSGAVAERIGGGVIALLGFIFFLRALGMMFEALMSASAISETELALLTTDFLAAPAWVAGGIFLWRRISFGYVAGLGLLFQACMLFVGLIPYCCSSRG